MNRTDLDKEIKSHVHSLRYEKGFVCSVDLFLKLNYLSPKSYEKWRFGEIEYLEKACSINLNKLTFVNKTMKKYALELKLEKSWTGYNQYGKGVRRRLIFSKSGNKVIENEYATHYVDKERIEKNSFRKTDL